MIDPARARTAVVRCRHVCRAGGCAERVLRRRGISCWSAILRKIWSVGFFCMNKGYFKPVSESIAAMRAEERAPDEQRQILFTSTHETTAW